MTDMEQRKAAKAFAEQWKDKGYEKGESQTFWLQLLQDVFGVENVSQFIRFEDTVHIDKATGFIDAFIDKTKVLIEQKSIDKDLRKAIKQSDGSLLNPFQQAKRYSAELPYDDRPRWIVTCNFKSFLVYDMNNPNGEPEEILLKDLAKEYYRLQFLVDSKSDHIKKEEELSFKAGELVGNLYDAFSKQYLDLENEQSQKDLNELCVRLVFCLYAEDAGLFGRKNIFHDYLAKYDDLSAMRKSLIELFKILDTPLDKRDPYLEDDLNQFPYVNGGLFSNENIEIPTFTQEIRDIILARASDDFDWSEISPTIFGAVFESTLNPDTRRSGGMHYTSIENIHKVIDPLFLDELRNMLDNALSYKNEKTRNEALSKFQEYLGSLKFFDPACGSGNFLTETYISLRRLENEAIAAKHGVMMAFDTGNIVNVQINQLYGIEINDFAVKVATAALWIAESQMLKETEKLLVRKLEFLPLKTYTNIYEGNALRVDWNNIISFEECNYIMGNPPFIGQQLRNREQAMDMMHIFNDNEQAGHLDYVTCWYKKACDYMTCNSKIKCSFVSTNSICQGEQVPILWSYLNRKYNLNIFFAHRSFHWNSESKEKAAVHCIIVGFKLGDFFGDKYIFDNGLCKKVNFINGYLVDAPMITLDVRKNNPPNGLPKLIKGSQPTDDGNLLLTLSEVESLIKNDFTIKDLIRPFNGAKEFLNSNNQEKYCLWLLDVDPSRFIHNKEIMCRINRVKEFRLKSSNIQTREASKTPHLFTQIRQPKHDYIMIPRVSSQNRRYIPMQYFSCNIIAGDTTSVLPNADLYIFGILESNVHMSWTRLVCGRLKSDYRYSPSVYNNFPWPNPTEEQKNIIMHTAKMILEARKKYPNCSLADMYGEKMYLFPELVKAHQLNDKAVWEAYGKKWNIKSESDCVAELMKMYQNLVNEEEII